MTLRIVFTVVLFLEAFIWASCVAKAPEAGVCERNCVNRSIGGGKLKVDRVGLESFYYECAGNGGAALSPIEAVFLVYEDNSSGDKPTTETDSSSSTAESNKAKRIPKGGISFTPLINIPVLGDHKNNRNTSTPSSEWCTDSCGYATLVVTPVCYWSKGTINIIVPGATGEVGDVEGGANKGIEIEIKKPE